MAFYVVAGLEVLCLLSYLTTLQDQAYLSVLVLSIQFVSKGFIFDIFCLLLVGFDV